MGEADYVRLLLDKLGEVLFWKIAMKPGRPLAYGRIGTAHFFGLPGNPVVGDGHLLPVRARCPHAASGQAQRAAGADCSRRGSRSPIRKAPGRTEFQRGILCGTATGYEVRTTGEQGSGILSSMSRANCFIVLPVDTGDVPAGAMVDVQILEGLI